uniref:Calmin n=1 Tax=Cynoglossus semilaevis TaxID=244447 RepID=A0A3P8WPT6_CYNSE
MAGHEWQDWFEREEFIAQISDIRVQNLQVEREEVQKRTFTRWMNLHLEKCDPPIKVHDLFKDIQDGHILMALLEELSGCKLLHGFKKSSHRIFRLNNIAKVLSFLEERNVKLVSIDAADVADGNPSIILGLIWNIILFFQIKELTGNIRSQFPSSSSLSSIPTSSDSDTSFGSAPSEQRQTASMAMRENNKAIKKLLQWVQKRTRKYGVAVQDFGKSWTSGLAFLAIIKSIDSTLIDMRKALLRNAKENVEDAFRIAHYSLGIPRLLEPDDLTTSAPDEQSIITYVAQFLEYFPGIEEPEEPHQIIERSISMGRLNFESDPFRSDIHRGRVKETSYRFQSDYLNKPPKILISSVSEDMGTMSPEFVPAAARAWSAEDVLAESPHVENISSRVLADAEDLTSKEKLFHSQSLSDSSVPECVNTESVLGDSAIGTPDSLMESDFGVISEKFCESRSDSFLCDSEGDVYHAIAVDVTSHDEGFMPFSDDGDTAEAFSDQETEIKTSPERMLELFEGDFEGKGSKSQERDIILDNNWSSLENTKELIESCEEKEVEVSTTCMANFENHNQDLVRDQTLCLEGKMNSQTESTNICNEEVGVGMETDSVCEEEKRGPRLETLIVHREEVLVETQTEADQEVLMCGQYPEDSINTDTDNPLVTTSLTKQHEEPDLPLSSICSEPEEQSQQKPCDLSDTLAYTGNDERTQPEKTTSNGTNPVFSVKNEDEPDCHSSRNDERNSVEISCHLEVADIDEEQDFSIPNTTDDEETMEKGCNLGEHPQTVFTDIDGRGLNSTDYNFQPLKSDQDELGDIFSDSDPTDTQQVMLNQLDSPVDCGMAVSCFESKAVDSPDVAVGRCSPLEDVVCDLIEPMDLFYPDKEEPMMAEPLYNELHSWPSVLSVSALQPAPVSETLLDDESGIGLDKESSNQLDVKSDKVNAIS